jgi:hypothetical protein
MHDPAAACHAGFSETSRPALGLTKLPMRGGGGYVPGDKAVGA